MKKLLLAVSMLTLFTGCGETTIKYVELRPPLRQPDRLSSILSLCQIYANQTVST